MDLNKSDIAVIVLAAGKGTRMKSVDANKVVSVLGDKPLILRTYENLKEQGFNNLYFIVGFAKESVMSVLGNRVNYIEQNEQLGTGHAVAVALPKIPKKIKKIIVMGGDDSAFYTDGIIKKFLTSQCKRGYKMSIMTTEVKTPTGLGRIIRNAYNSHHVQKIVEEKNASEEQKKIKEVNTGCYIFDRKFLEENIKKINKNPISGEYYLTDMLAIAVNKGEPVFAFRVPNKYFHGVNTPEELEAANRVIK